MQHPRPDEPAPGETIRPAPPPNLGWGRDWPVPTDKECLEYWDRFRMPDHIREHSHKVAQVAGFLAQKGLHGGYKVCVESVRASAMMHDISKHYCILHGGNHAQLGGVWTLACFHNPAIAQGVLHHVFWPFPLELDKYFLPLAVIYADKRIRHDRVVPLKQRFEDLLERYCTNEAMRQRMNVGMVQAEALEAMFRDLIGEDIDASTFDSRRLV